MLHVAEYLLAPVSGVLRRMQDSVGVAPPTAAMLATEDLHSCALLRRLPALRDKIAWRQLGDRFPTPVHETTVQSESGAQLHFHAKREDLSSSLYGGNKVRTLQFQLAVIEARLEAGEPDVLPLTVIGTYGSNQNVATAVHAAHAIPSLLPSLNVALLEPEVADMDNTLNVLSVLSIGRTLPLLDLLRSVPAILRAAILGRGTVLTLGGNSPSGVLGQVSAMLELAEQIEAGEAVDPERIYVAVGSSCTVSGLVVGCALSRRLGLTAFSSPRFRLCGVLVHHLFALAQRRFDFHRRWHSLPLSVGQTIRATCAQLASLGAPDVTAEALQILDAQVDLNDDAQLCGLYGGHSPLSRAASRRYDATGSTYSTDPRSGERTAERPLWLCGHFVAKPFAAMLCVRRDSNPRSPSRRPSPIRALRCARWNPSAGSADLEAAHHAGETPPRCLLWQTKSAVQPRGHSDEWARLRTMPKHLRRWAAEGPAESSLRPGKVDPFGGGPDEYRAAMTTVPLD